MWEQLREMLRPYKRVAMQYSPKNQIMYVSLVDGGTLELVRGFGVEVVSSADLVARFEATLSPEQIATHFEARDAMDRDHGSLLPVGWATTARPEAPTNSRCSSGSPRLSAASSSSPTICPS